MKLVSPSFKHTFKKKQISIFLLISLAVIFLSPPWNSEDADESCVFVPAAACDVSFDTLTRFYMYNMQLKARRACVLTGGLMRQPQWCQLRAVTSCCWPHVGLRHTRTHTRPATRRVLMIKHVVNTCRRERKQTASCCRNVSFPCALIHNHPFSKCAAVMAAAAWQSPGRRHRRRIVPLSHARRC